MRFSSLVERIGGEGAQAWDIHVRAVARKRKGDKIILLSIGDPDFDTPAAIVEACIASLRGGNTHYTDIAGERGLREAIARRNADLTGRPTSPEQVVVFSGAQNALFAASLCLLDREDEVISPEPMYVTYEAVIGTTGAILVPVPLLRQTNFHLDVEAIGAAVTAKTRAILLNTPHNPTGAVYTRRELEAVADICLKRDLWLISDEVYATLTFENEHVSPASLPGMAERTVIVSSISKSHAMTGWRVGWAVSPPAVVPHLRNLALCMLYGGPGFIQDAAAHGLDHEPAELAQMRDELKARRDMLCDALSGLRGVECLRPEGAMFVMLDVRGTGRTAHEFAAGLLDEFDVAVLPADAFGPTAKGHVRISLSVDQPTLAEASRRIVRYVSALER